ncbi:hypothetical protein OOT08_08600, partial [Leucobacter sp. M11]|nr:hypothetical protein [Leucobacter sp. M11]
QRTRPAASLGPARETERSGRAEGGPGLAGAVRITPAVASDSLRRALSDDPDIQSIRVSGPQLRAGAGLVLSITARRGASPARIADVAERALTRWQDLLGAEHPTLIRIGHGSADPRAALDRPGGNDSRPSPAGSAARAPGHTAASVSPQHTFDHTTRPIT